jgi:hypothetical protein
LARPRPYAHSRFPPDALRAVIEFEYFSGKSDRGLVADRALAKEFVREVHNGDAPCSA